MKNISSIECFKMSQNIIVNKDLKLPIKLKKKKIVSRDMKEMMEEHNNNQETLDNTDKKVAELMEASQGQFTKLKVHSVTR